MRNQTILVDINKETCKVLKYKQYDNNNTLQIIVEENYKKINLNEYVGFAFFELPSGLIIKKECEIKDNVITIIIDNNVLSEEGKVLLDLTLSDGEDTFTLFRINLVIEGTIDRDEAIIIEAGWDIAAEIAKIDKAEKQRVANEEKRITAENERAEFYNIYNTRMDEIEEQLSYITVRLDDYSNLSYNGENWSPALQKALDDIAETGGTILLGKNNYKFSGGVTIAPTIGNQNYSTCRKFKITSTNKATMEYTGDYTNFIVFGSESWEYSEQNPAKGYIDVTLENLILTNNGSPSVFTTGIYALNTRKILLEDVEIRGFNIGIRTKGTWCCSQLKRVVIWNESAAEDTRGIHLDSGSNNISFENVTVSNYYTGVYVCPINEISGVSTCSFRNCNFEFNNIAFDINPYAQNVGSINIDGCHFENNNQILNIGNAHTVWNINLRNSLLMHGGILIWGSANNAIIKGVSIENNVFLGDVKTYEINLGVSIPDNLENIYLGSNQYNGYYNIKRPDMKLKNVPQFFESMPMYSGTNQIPWGREDTNGQIGEFRHDANNLYFKSLNGWKCIPLNTQHEYNGEINGIRTWNYIPETIVPANGSKEISITVDGVKNNLEYAIMVSPSSWFEPGIACNAYKKGDNEIYIRFVNVTNEEKTISYQRYNIVCQVINF